MTKTAKAVVMDKAKMSFPALSIARKGVKEVNFQALIEKCQIALLKGDVVSKRAERYAKAIKRAEENLAQIRAKGETPASATKALRTLYETEIKGVTFKALVDEFAEKAKQVASRGLSVTDEQKEILAKYHVVEAQKIWLSITHVCAFLRAHGEDVADITKVEATPEPVEEPAGN